MRKLLPILLLLVALTASAADRISMTVTVTNTAVTGDVMVINGAFRIWTNAHSSTTILTNLVSKNHTATNLFNNYASFPFGSGVIQEWVNTNQVRFRAPFGAALSGSVTGTWATITLSTQSGPQTYTALWPLENIVGETNRTNQGSALVSGLSTYSTNAFGTNSTATSNHITKGASPEQIVSSPLTIGGALRSRSQVFLTNGFTRAVTNINPVFSNAVNYGSAISSPGSGTSSEQFGSGATASGTASLAVGLNAIAPSNSTVAIGSSAEASGDYATAIGQAAQAGKEGAIAVGNNTEASGTNSIVLGSSSSASGSEGVSIGYGVVNSTDYRIVIGGSGHTIAMGGLFSGPVQTNTTLKGTNIVNGRLDLKSRAVSSVANGYNDSTVLIPGTNVYIRFSGPSGAYTNHGFAAGQDGSWHIAQFDNPGLSVVFLHESGGDAAENRILTGTGAEARSTNNPAMLEMIYDGNSARWRIISLR